RWLRRNDKRPENTADPSARSGGWEESLLMQVIIPDRAAPATRSEASDLDTVPKLLLRNAREYADRAAIRHKGFGIWQTWTWAGLADEVRAFAIGLRKIGVERGDTVAIIGDNRPRLYATFAAVQSLGGVPVPVYQDSVADEMAYVLEHAEVEFAVVEDQEQV